MKGTIYICAGVGSLVGAYVPALLGDKSGIFSVWSILGSLVGGIAGIWVGYKLYNS